MIDYKKIKNWNDCITKKMNKLKLETDLDTQQKLRYQIGILNLKIKLERLN
jgi:hypothetical protein